MGATEKSLQIGEVVECRYHIVSEGAFQDLGTVYRAHDVRYDRPVTVLVLSRRFGTGFEALKRIAQANERVTELHVPALVPLEYVGLIEEQPYLVYNLETGYSLAELEHQTGKLTVDVALEIAVRVCDALAPLHKAGLVHGGLSAHSIWLGIQEGHGGQDLSLEADRWLGADVAVTDAWLVPALRSLFAAPDQPWGRPPYLSPEQAAGSTVRPSTDVYVIGLLLYEMLAGRLPFRASDEMVLAVQHLRLDPPSLEIWAPKVPPALSQIIQKALAKEPAARYRTAGQMVYVLRAQFEQLKANPAPPPLPEQDRLVVPPPPVPTTTPRVHRYEMWAEDEDWSEETVGVDWLMVVLIAAAVIAVLGLIPLWQTVYHRYAVPIPVSAPSSYYWSDSGAGFILIETGGPENQPTTGLRLDNFGLVWYNLVMPCAFPTQLAVDSWVGSQKITIIGDAVKDLDYQT